ncbi:tRNA epoxyqueuosine(34) reductase QueG [Hallella sp.]|uniref:tRNA epoxyqueuosine(34) reductase QueG n=1 Tax=Hallella sp. TaxID=2980186 RepID=UPI002589FECF|nr:tRNA epoxyqueuosine(34) reductase QueG [Hallella sp.]MDD7146543.1 tRNA epoxyqueuosine(34) reductase QueG [Hallella sp.]MDY5925027.1 tRNA epoxyqueuosine(34) reductase QueG [Hallella sp.]
MPLSRHDLTALIKAEAQKLGFAACGVAQASHVSEDEEAHLRRWLDEGKYAGMHYMTNYLDKRLDPRKLMDGLKSIVSLAMNYAPERRLAAGEPQIAAYALGKDYHDVMKERIHRLAAFVSEQVGRELTYRAFVDSGPVLERYWAVQAGLGWVGRNHLLIIPKAGSEFFLGELFLDIELDYDQPMANRCGHCHRCVDQCPTHALSYTHAFDAHLCLSYQTIENRGELSDDAKAKMGAFIYGCDRCQLACPWNRFAHPTNIAEFQPSEELLSMTRQQWEQLSEDDYRRLFKGSAVKRAKYAGLMRNIHNMSAQTSATTHPSNDEPTPSEP